MHFSSVKQGFVGRRPLCRGGPRVACRRSPPRLWFADGWLAGAGLLAIVFGPCTPSVKQGVVERRPLVWLLRGWLVGGSSSPCLRPLALLLSYARCVAWPRLVWVVWDAPRHGRCSCCLVNVSLVPTVSLAFGSWCRVASLHLWNAAAAFVLYLEACAG